MERIQEIRRICGVWCVKVRTPGGAVVLACSRDRQEAIGKALRAEPEPA